MAVESDWLDPLAIVGERFPVARGNEVGYLAVAVADRLRRYRHTPSKGIVVVGGQPHTLHVEANGSRAKADRLTVVRRLAPGVVDLTMHRPRQPGEDLSHNPNACWRFVVDNGAGTLAEVDEPGFYRSPYTFPLRPERPQEGRIVRGRVATALLGALSQPETNPAIPGNAAAAQLFEQIAPHHLAEPLREAVYLAIANGVAHGT
jgi:hypothetical protein